MFLPVACVAGPKQVSRPQGLTIIDISDVHLLSWIFIKLVSKTIKGQDSGIQLTKWSQPSNLHMCAPAKPIKGSQQQSLAGKVGHCQGQWHCLRFLKKQCLRLGFLKKGIY